MKTARHNAFIFGCLMLILARTAPPAVAQAPITTPKAHFGSSIGDDYFLANYEQMIAYWTKLDQESDRLTLVDIGETAEGRRMIMAIVTSEANHRNLPRYREIARTLAKAEQPETTARELAAEGKAVVWIDGGLHADEVLSSQQLIQAVFEMVSRTDTEMTRILDNVIVLATIVNPDGMDFVSNWYMRESNPMRRTLEGLPRLYQKYAGHDNNRDFYMSALPESRAVNRVLYRDWFPQIVYDHHQSGPPGTVMFTPPFRDPFNFNFDPLVMTMVDEVGAAIQSRLTSENKPGITSRSGGNYSAWWNGGLRTSPYFHNMIGILTETIGNPTPIEIPFVANRQLPTADSPFPIAPQQWHFRQGIEYSLSANWAVLDYAARNKDRLLLNIYRMGRNSIERGSADHWTQSPRDLRQSQSVDVPFIQLRKPENRDARAYVIPANQADFLTATKFVNTLIFNGITVLRATAPFSAAGKSYPAGSYVVNTAQAFRPHILDMFEPQDHPDDFAFPGAPPTPPYDNAGWTLAYQMGVRFDRILDPVEGVFTPIEEEVRPPQGTITQVTRPAGYLFTHEANDSFVALNRLVQGGDSVYWLSERVTAEGKAWPVGTHYVSAASSTLPRLQQLAQDVGLNFQAVSRAPDSAALRLQPTRIGLWDRHGGSTSSGWTRFVLEQFEFPHTVAFADSFADGRLSEKFDVIIFVDDAMDTPSASGNLATQLRTFLDDGGTVLAIGGSTVLGYAAGLPMTNALIEVERGRTQPLPQTKFYVPGSILQARVDTEHPIGYGFNESVDFFFDRSPAFRLNPNARDRGTRPVAWFDSATPLRSGWAWGQNYLKDTVAVLEAQVGRGKIVLYGPEILFRAQPHGTFKFLFNGIYAARAERTQLGE